MGMIDSTDSTTPTVPVPFIDLVSNHVRCFLQTQEWDAETHIRDLVEVYQCAGFVESP